MLRDRILVLCFLLLPLSGAIHAVTDEGASHNLILKYSLSEKWFLISRSNMATRNNNEDRFISYTGLGVGYQLNKQWSLRAGYRHFWFRPGDTWLEENRPYFEGYFADYWSGFRVTNRSRAEVRLFDYKDDDVRFRNEITIEAPWKLTALELQPYLEEEFFYGFDQSEFEANWLGGGFSWKPLDGVKLKLGYRWVYQRVGENWLNRNVIVTGVNLYF
jgi:hypothetical protein